MPTLYLNDASFNGGHSVKRSILTELREGDLFVPCTVLDVNEHMIPMDYICCAVTFSDENGFFTVRYVRPFMRNKPELGDGVGLNFDCITDLEDPEVYILSLDIYTKM